MKKSILVIVGALIVSSVAQANVPVSVLAFKNKVGSSACSQDWYWWRDNLGTAFQDMLVTELAKVDDIELLERENIHQIDSMEVNLVNSEDSSHKIQKGKFTKAKYTVIGAVTGYEYCADKKKVSVAVGAVAGFLGMSGAVRDVADTVDEVGISKAHAKVIVDVRVIETQTGRIVKSIKAEGTAERSNFKINSSLADYQDASETPVGEAARMAIEKASATILPVFSKKVAKN